MKTRPPSMRKPTFECGFNCLQLIKKVFMKQDILLQSSISIKWKFTNDIGSWFVYHMAEMWKEYKIVKQLDKLKWVFVQTVFRMYCNRIWEYS